MYLLNSGKAIVLASMNLLTHQGQYKLQGLHQSLQTHYTLTHTAAIYYMQTVHAGGLVKWTFKWKW